MIVAANYAAKGLGVVRGMTVDEGKKKLPTVHTIHVDTISPENEYHQHVLDSDYSPDRQREKVNGPKKWPR